MTGCRKNDLLDAAVAACMLVPTSEVLVGANRPREVECGNESGNDCDFPLSQTLLNVA